MYDKKRKNKKTEIVYPSVRGPSDNVSSIFVEVVKRFVVVFIAVALTCIAIGILATR